MEKMAVTEKQFPMHQHLLAQQVLPAPQALQVLRVQQVPPDLLVQVVEVRVLRVQQVHKDHKVFKAHKEKPEQPAHKEKQEQPAQQVPQVLLN
jgi:hypothetical protein